MSGAHTPRDPRTAPGRTPAVIRLYPASYRRAHGAEIAATLAEVADGEGRFCVLREEAAVAGHALRMRTGLDSARPGGRALAALVPYTVALAASLSAALLAVWPLEPLERDVGTTGTPLACAPWLWVLGCLLAGRWPWARAGVFAAVAGAGLSVPLAHLLDGAAGVERTLPTLLGLALAAVSVLAGPPDLPPAAPRERRTAGLTALALGVPLVVASVTVFPSDGTPAGVLEAARPDALRLFWNFAPFVLAFPATLGLARTRYGGWAAGALLVAAFLVRVPSGLLGTVFPYAVGGTVSSLAFLTGVAALLVRLLMRLRTAWRERRTM